MEKFFKYLNHFWDFSYRDQLSNTDITGIITGIEIYTGNNLTEAIATSEPTRTISTQTIFSGECDSV